MKRLILEDLSGFTEKEVKVHISEQYAGDKSGFDYGCPENKDKSELLKELKRFNIVIAYESVGSWGCDSSSYFLMQRKNDGVYFEFSGGHCSCYGFEGQYDPQEATIEYLKSDKFYFYCGGYDDNETDNQKAVEEFLAAL